MGLLSLVPILGWVAATGWMLATLDGLRAGRHELPPVGLHLRRGWRLVVVLLLYAVPILVVTVVLVVPGFLLASAYHDTALAVPGIFLVLAGCAFGVLAIIALTTVLLPEIVVATDHGGLRSGLRFAVVVSNVRAHLNASVTAALLLVVIYALGSVGALLCVVGMVLTTGYTFPVLAGVLRGYERDVYSSGELRQDQGGTTS